MYAIAPTLLGARFIMLLHSVATHLIFISALIISTGKEAHLMLAVIVALAKLSRHPVTDSHTVCEGEVLQVLPAAGRLHNQVTQWTTEHYQD